PPSELVRFVELFNSGDFFEAHEVLERPWREHRSPTYKALILFASLFVHARRGNPRGVQKQATKVLGALSALPAQHLGIDLAALARTTRRFEQAARDGSFRQLLAAEAPQLAIDWRMGSL
ncbi:MAG: DUF309 domain-containing protein, partial [Myxococcales bacterium]|nr:DUF309 domain-containing protein [Myxococcales bacterium]